MRLVLVASFITALALLAGCGHSHEEFDNLPDCVADHLEEGLSEPNSITTCLLDHLDVEFADQAECETYVESMGYAASATQACTDYFAEQ